MFHGRENASFPLISQICSSQWLTIWGSVYIIPTRGIPNNKLVGGLERFLFFHILGIIIPTAFHIFQRGRSTTNQTFVGDHLLLGLPHYNPDVPVARVEMSQIQTTNRRPKMQAGQRFGDVWGADSQRNRAMDCIYFPKNFLMGNMRYLLRHDN